MMYAPSLSYLFKIFKIFFSVTFALNHGIPDAAETSNDDVGNEINKATASIPANNLFNTFISTSPFHRLFHYNYESISAQGLLKNITPLQACTLHDPAGALRIDHFSGIIILWKHFCKGIRTAPL